MLEEQTAQVEHVLEGKRCLDFSGLPRDIIVVILLHTDAETTGKVMCCSKRLRDVAGDDILWEVFFMAVFKSTSFGEQGLAGWYKRFLSFRCPVSSSEEKQLNRVGQWILFTGQSEGQTKNRNAIRCRRRSLEDARLTTFENLFAKDGYDHAADSAEEDCSLLETMSRLSSLTLFGLRTIMHMPYAFSRTLFQKQVDLPDDFLSDYEMESGTSWRRRGFKKA
mmetsp:Transcript_17325/g.43202  ORF Transcript_17325/g.43202 Transcript_17325/m.43202 type:complete len:222 (-) Transcript_17325:455-1120(-)